MVIIRAVEVRIIEAGWESAGQDVMHGLDMEGLLDFGIWSNKKVKEDQSREKQRENGRYEKQISSSAGCSIKVNQP